MKTFSTLTFNIVLLLFLVSSISFGQKKVQPIIEITRITTDEPNSAGGVNLNISWENLSKKTIKYIKFGVDPYNRVNDPVACEITGDVRKYCESVGPHDPGATESATWENVWYNNTIVRAKIEDITITWMNGTTKFLSKKEFRVTTE